MSIHEDANELFCISLVIYIDPHKSVNLEPVYSSFYLQNWQIYH